MGSTPALVRVASLSGVRPLNAQRVLLTMVSQLIEVIIYIACNLRSKMGSPIDDEIAMKWIT